MPANSFTWLDTYRDGRAPPEWYVEMCTTGVVPPFLWELFDDTDEHNLMEFVVVFLIDLVDLFPNLNPLFYTLPFTFGILSIHDEITPEVTLIKVVINIKDDAFYNALRDAGLLG